MQRCVWAVARRRAWKVAFRDPDLVRRLSRVRLQDAYASTIIIPLLAFIPASYESERQSIQKSLFGRMA